MDINHFCTCHLMGPSQHLWASCGKCRVLISCWMMVIKLTWPKHREDHRPHTDAAQIHRIWNRTENMNEWMCRMMSSVCFVGCGAALTVSSGWELRCSPRVADTEPDAEQKWCDRVWGAECFLCTIPTQHHTPPWLMIRSIHRVRCLAFLWAESSRWIVISHLKNQLHYKQSATKHDTKSCENKTFQLTFSRRMLSLCAYLSMPCLIPV